MEKYGKLIAPHTLQFERLFPGPIVRVWEYIVDPDKRSQWYAGGSKGAKPKDEFSLIFRNSQFSTPPDPTPEKFKDFGDDYESKAIVLQCEAPHLFVMEWEGVVTFKLEEQGKMVKLTLTHEKLADNKETRVGTLAGWHGHLDILADRFANKAPEGFWRRHDVLEQAYSKRVS